MKKGRRVRDDGLEAWKSEAMMVVNKGAMTMESRRKRRCSRLARARRCVGGVGSSERSTVGTQGGLGGGGGEVASTLPPPR